MISRKWLEGDIRLVGGPRKFMGTVVFLHNGKWGAVCDDRWDMKDASVVCRQLGYTLALRATTQSEFGPGRSKCKVIMQHIVSITLMRCCEKDVQMHTVL